MLYPKTSCDQSNAPRDALLCRRQVCRVGEATASATMHMDRPRPKARRARSPVPAQMWAQSRRRCGPVPAQMWAQSRRARSPVPAQMWAQSGADVGGAHEFAVESTMFDRTRASIRMRKLKPRTTALSHRGSAEAEPPSLALPGRVAQHHRAKHRNSSEPSTADSLHPSFLIPPQHYDPYTPQPQRLHKPTRVCRALRPQTCPNLGGKFQNP